MGRNTPSVIKTVTGNTTYTGNQHVFWVNVATTAASVVTIGDDTAEKIRITVAANDSKYLCFTPAIHCKTSVKITLASGTATINICKSGA